MIDPNTFLLLNFQAKQMGAGCVSHEVFLDRCPTNKGSYGD